MHLIKKKMQLITDKRSKVDGNRSALSHDCITFFRVSALHFRVRGEFHFTPPLKMELHFGVKQNFLTQNFLLKYHALYHRGLFCERPTSEMKIITGLSFATVLSHGMSYIYETTLPNLTTIS